MDEILKQTILELWHISRTALNSNSHSRYDRMIYIKNELYKSHSSLLDNLSSKKVWFFIEDTLN